MLKLYYSNLENIVHFGVCLKYGIYTEKKGRYYS